MARNIKKVKVQKQPHSKKFWVILSSIIVAGILAIAGIITLVVMLTNKKEETYDYFESIPSDSYATAAKLESYKDASIEHIFVYYFDKTINPDDITDFSEIQTKVTSLYNLIKEYNKKDSKESSVAFFLVDTSTVAGAAALNNTNLGNISSTNQLAYMYEGVYSSYAYGVKDGEDVLSGSTITEIKSAILFVSNLK